MLKSAVALAFIAGIGAANAQETAQPVPVPASACIQSDKLLKIHKEKWNEAPALGGATGDGGFILFASPKGETWTIVSVRPDGQSCMVLSGVNLSRAKQGQEI